MTCRSRLRVIHQFRRTSFDAHVAGVLKDRDFASTTLQLSPEKYQPQAVLENSGVRIWELAALSEVSRLAVGDGEIWRRRELRAESLLSVGHGFQCDQRRRMILTAR